MSGPDDAAVAIVVLEAPDGERSSFPCVVGQDLPTAAVAAGCRPRVVCAQGGCGACRAVLVEGRVEHRGGVSQDKLKGPEPDHPGYVLMCRAFPLEDVLLRPVHRWARRPVRRLSAKLPPPTDRPGTH